MTTSNEDIGPQAPCTRHILILGHAPGPTTGEIELAKRSLARFLETAEPEIKEINRKFPGLISVRVPPANSATIPALAPFFQTKHQANVEAAKKGNIDVLFMGDSITDFWRNSDEYPASRFDHTDEQ